MRDAAKKAIKGHKKLEKETERSADQDGNVAKGKDSESAVANLTSIEVSVSDELQSRVVQEDQGEPDPDEVVVLSSEIIKEGGGAAAAHGAGHAADGKKARKPRKKPDPVLFTMLTRSAAAKESRSFRQLGIKRPAKERSTSTK